MAQREGFLAVTLANPLATAASLVIVVGVFAAVWMNRTAVPVEVIPVQTAARSTSAQIDPAPLTTNPLIDQTVTTSKPDIRVERAAYRAERQHINAPAVYASAASSGYLPGEESYVKTISSLNNTVKDQKDALLRPSERIAYERDMALVNDTIAKIKTEVKRNPRNGSARQVLYSSYQNKIDLLNSVAQKEELVDKPSLGLKKTDLMKKIIENLNLVIVTIITLADFPFLAPAQNTWSGPMPKPNPTLAPSQPDRPSSSTPEPLMSAIHFGGNTSEKSIMVDSGVNLSLCIPQGTVKVNGWKRNEVRVFVDGGSKFGFKVLQKSAKKGDPVWIMVAGIEKNKNKYSAPTECIWGNEIEIDVPLNATINIRGRQTTTKIDSVKKVNVNTIGGDISLRNFSNGITANAGQGDITVEESEDAMILDSTTGNILVFEAGPSDIGDMLKAKTNSGSISMQQIAHRQIEVNSISGSVAFNGEMLNGGLYSMSTSRGSIRLAIPSASSCKISATYGYGSFNREIPVKLDTENISEGPVKSIVGTLGKGGDATLELTSNNGSIVIKKQ
ncbi:MAG: DUF4097 family beta strand repeat-containing protein [Pyrinomonadaceae bacterium]